MMRDGLLRGGLTKNLCGMRQMDGRQLMARGTDSCHAFSLVLLLCLVLSCHHQHWVEHRVRVTG